MSMLRLTSVKIQDNTTLRGAMAEKGVNPSELSIPRVVIESPRVHAKVHELMKEALLPLVQKIADFGGSNGASTEVLAACMLENIESFRLDAGSGYTSTRKLQLVEEGRLTAEDFIPPKKGGTVSSGNVVTGDIDI
jgi:hypothetical protein